MVVGSSTGPQIFMYDPKTGEGGWVENPSYERGKKTAVTAGQDTQYIVREDPVTGELSFTENQNYNPWSPANRIEGKGAAEGKVMYVDKDGQQHVLDMLSPSERADIAAKAKAESEGIVADTEKKKIEAAKAQKEQEELAAIDAAIDAGASPAEVRGMIQKAAQSVTDFVNLQNSETQRQTQLEASRHNLAAEESESRARRTAETAQATAGAESYGRWGIATAPFQTALLGSLSQVADPRKVAGTMNINPSVFEPVGQAYDKQQAGLAESASRRGDVQKKIDEPYTSPYKAGGSTGATGGTSGANPAQPATGGTTTTTTTAQPAASPGQTAQREVDQSRAAVDLGNGQARTYYTDGSWEDWDIPQVEQAEPVPEEEAGGGAYFGLGPGAGGQGGGSPTAPGGPVAPRYPPMPPVQGPEEIGVGGYFVGGGEYDDHPSRGGKVQFTPMYVPRYSPGGAAPPNAGGPGGGGEQGGQGSTGPLRGHGGGSTAQAAARPRQARPVPGQRLGQDGVRRRGGGGLARRGRLGLGGRGRRGRRVLGRRPPAAAGRVGPGHRGRGREPVDAAPRAQRQRGLRGRDGADPGGPGRAAPAGGRPAGEPAGVAGGFGGPAPRGGSPGGGGGQYGQNMAPMWDSASPAPFMSSGVGGPSGAAGQATLYRSGASAGGGSSRAGEFNPQRALDPPKHNGSYYGGPGAPQAMTPLQRLLQQTGVIPFSAGRASGSPGTV